MSQAWRVLIMLATCSLSLSFLSPMCQQDKIAVVIPCLNEGNTIGPLVSEIRRHLRNVFVVNDGSTDSTAAAAANAEAKVIDHARSQGKGASLRTGFNAAIQAGFAWALAMDGDGQHAPSDIPGFLRAVERTDASLLVGDRMGNAQCMPVVRRFVNRWMSRKISEFCNAEVLDSQCGFRMVNLHDWRRLPFSSNHFEIESEMIIRFLSAGGTIDFVPIQTRYAAEISKIRPVRDTLRWFRWWFSIRNELCASPIQLRFKSAPQDVAA
jgi:glycosyltransferase involved in cell wall biosynthesis